MLASLGAGQLVFLSFSGMHRTRTRSLLGPLVGGGAGGVVRCSCHSVRTNCLDPAAGSRESHTQAMDRVMGPPGAVRSR